jgi:hypothetical protein
MEKLLTASSFRRSVWILTELVLPTLWRDFLGDRILDYIKVKHHHLPNPILIKRVAKLDMCKTNGETSNCLLVQKECLDTHRTGSAHTVKGFPRWWGPWLHKGNAPSSPSKDSTSLVRAGRKTIQFQVGNFKTWRYRSCLPWLGK